MGSSGSDRCGVPKSSSPTPMTTAISPAVNPTIMPSHDEIAQAARERWVEAGHPEGRDDEFGFHGEHRLLMVRQVPNVSAAILATRAQPVTRTNITKNTASEKVRRQR